MDAWFVPEIESENIEYKRKLTKDDETRISGLVSQLIWRLAEGYGIAYYMLGVNDNGSPYDINDEELQLSLKILNIMCKKAFAEIKDIEEIVCCGIVVRKITIISENKIVPEKRFIIQGKYSVEYLTHLTFGNKKLTSYIYNNEIEMENNKVMSLIIKYTGENENEINNNVNCVNLQEIKKKSSQINVYFILPVKINRNYLNLYNFIDNIITVDSLNFEENVIEPYEKENVNGIILLKIFLKEDYIIVGCSNNVSISNNDVFMFNDVEFTILKLRYFNRAIKTLDKSVTFTATVQTTHNLFKYKRNIFIKK